MTSTVSIKRLEPGDEGLLIRLSGQFYNSYLSDKAAGALLRRPGHVVLCIQKEDILIGFSYFHLLPKWYTEEEELLVYDLEIAEPHRRKGWGRRLFQEIFRFAEEREISTVWLMAERSNGTALKFYKALGGTVQEEEALLIEFYP